MRLFQIPWRIVTIAAIAAVTLGSAPRRPYTPRERAFFADPAVVEFVRPGLGIAVNAAIIAPDGTIAVVYTITDPNGLPLDAAGVTTPGTVGLSFVAAVLANNQEDYPA